MFHYELSGSGFFIQCSFQSTGQLIAAGGILESAGVAGEQLNNAGCIHSLDQLGDGFQIAVASAGELHVFYNTLLQIEGDLRGSGALGFIGVIHSFYSFRFSQYDYATIIKKYTLPMPSCQVQWKGLCPKGISVYSETPIA